MSSQTAKRQLETLQRLAAGSVVDEREARPLLVEALARGEARVAIAAAKLITEQLLGGYEEELASAYAALAGERVAADPGCLAKEALLAALDALEHSDAELFAAAATYVQRERAKGGLRDSAGRVRARGVLGLARLGHVDLLPILGVCLGDHDPLVRLSAARAVGHRGQRDGAGLLLLRLGAGDDDEIFGESLKALFAVAPDWALRHARELLAESAARGRETLLHALGTAPHDGAIELLVAELEKCTLATERRELIAALGLSLRPLARASLLELVRDGRASDGEVALTALAIHRYDPRLSAQLREVVDQRPELARRFAELFVD